MKNSNAYQTKPFTINRRLVAVSAKVGRQQNNIQSMIEVDVSKPRHLTKEYKNRTGESLSLTAYVVSCLAQAVKEFPAVNAIRKGNKHIVFENVTIGVLVERELDGELVPDSLGIKDAQVKSYRQIHNEIRTAQTHVEDGIGGLSGMRWVRLIPGFLLHLFFRLASKNMKIVDRYGAVCVTAVGMFGPRNQAMWFVPLVGGASVGVTVGGIVERPHIHGNQIEGREHLCLTITFNHDIVDGAPAARFIKRFSELLMSGALIESEIEKL